MFWAPGDIQDTSGFIYSLQYISICRLILPANFVLLWIHFQRSQALRPLKVDLEKNKVSSSLFVSPSDKSHAILKINV